MVFPVAPVFLILSEPAKSTKWNFAEMFSSEVTGSASGSAYPSAGCITFTIFWSIVTVKMACDLEEASFIKVDAVIRLAIPLLRSEVHSVLLVTSSALSPVTLIEPFFASEILRTLLLWPVLGSIVAASSKSLMSSP